MSAYSGVPLPSPSRRPGRRVNAVGADSPECLDRFDSLEPTTLGARISVAVNRELAHLSDEALVALAARSEQSALAELYDRYGRPAYGLALRIVRDEALAEDAVQEGFLALWRTAARFVPERGKASTWILTGGHRGAAHRGGLEEGRRPDTPEGAADPSSDTDVDEEA